MRPRRLEAFQADESPRLRRTRGGRKVGEVKSPLQQYLEQIHETPLLTASQEKSLAHLLHRVNKKTTRATRTLRRLLPQYLDEEPMQRVLHSVKQMILREADRVGMLPPDARPLMTQKHAPRESVEGVATTTHGRVKETVLLPSEGNGSATTESLERQYAQEALLALAAKVQCQSFQFTPVSTETTDTALLDNVLALSESERRNALAHTIMTSDLKLGNIDVAGALLTIATKLLEILQEQGPRVCREAMEEVDDEVMHSCKEDAHLTAYLKRCGKGNGYVPIIDAKTPRNLLIQANLRLVVSIARKYTGRGLSLSDLVSEGNLKLMRAVDGFNPDMNVRFSTYAHYGVEQSMQRAVMNTGKTMRIPIYMAELIAKWNHTSTALRDELQHEPTDEEIAAKLNLKPRRVKLLKRAISLHQTQTSRNGSDGTQEDFPLEELLGEAGDRSPIEEMIEDEEIETLNALLEQLSPDHAEIIQRRFGLHGGEAETLEDIAETRKLCHERIRQIEAETIGILRKGMLHDEDEDEE